MSHQLMHVRVVHYETSEGSPHIHTALSTARTTNASRGSRHLARHTRAARHTEYTPSSERNWRDALAAVARHERQRDRETIHA